MTTVHNPRYSKTIWNILVLVALTLASMALIRGGNKVFGFLTLSFAILDFFFKVSQRDHLREIVLDDELLTLISANKTKNYIRKDSIQSYFIDNKSIVLYFQTNDKNDIYIFPKSGFNSKAWTHLLTLMKENFVEQNVSS